MHYACRETSCTSARVISNAFFAIYSEIHLFLQPSKFIFQFSANVDEYHLMISPSNGLTINVDDMDSRKNVSRALSPSSSLLAAGYPKRFVALVILCFVSAIAGLVLFLSISGQDGESYFYSSEFLVLFGVVNSIFGSLQTAVGYCCQRIAFKLVAINANVGPASKHPIYITGLTLLVFGTFAAVINLGLLDQSATAPFAALTLIFNGYLGRKVLQESVTKWDMYASITMLFGIFFSIIGVSMATMDTENYTLVILEDRIFRSSLPMLYTAVAFLTISIFSYHVKRKNLDSSSKGLLCFSASAGFMSGFTSMTVKCSIEIMKGVMTDHSHDLKNPLSYLFFILAPLFLCAQLHFMNLGLEHFGTLKFVPLYHAFIIFSNMANGLIYFDEGKNYGTMSILLFSLGGLFSISGVIILLLKASIFENGKNSNHFGNKSSTHLENNSNFENALSTPLASAPGGVQYSLERTTL